MGNKKNKPTIKPQKLWGEQSPSFPTQTGESTSVLCCEFQPALICCQRQKLGGCVSGIFIWTIPGHVPDGSACSQSSPEIPKIRFPVLAAGAGCVFVGSTLCCNGLKEFGGIGCLLFRVSWTSVAGICNHQNTAVQIPSSLGEEFLATALGMRETWG